MSLPSAVRAFIDANVPLVLWGPPGTGKTATVCAAGARKGAHVEVLIGSVLDPVDIGGHLALGADGRVCISPPPWARRMHEALSRGKEAWLFLDEMSCAPASVQAALLRVVQERQVAGIDLGACRVIGAANPAETAADGGWLSAATANRWAHIDWVLDPVAWRVGVVSGWGTPLRSEVAKVATSVANWIAKAPGALLDVPKNIEDAGRAWPSPRSWSNAIMALAQLPLGARDPLAIAVAAACVGGAAANEWQAYEVATDLPDPEDVLAGRAGLPARGDQLRAAVFAVVATAASDHNDRDARLAKAVSIVAGLRPDQAVPPAKVLLAALDGEVPPELRHLGEALRSMNVSVKAP